MVQAGRLRIDTPVASIRGRGLAGAFGTALDLTAAELSIEAFLPADEATAAALL